MCFVGIHDLFLRVLGSMTIDIWAKIKGVWVFIKLWDLRHLIFPNGDCKQDVILKGRIRSDTPVKVSWELKVLLS